MRMKKKANKYYFFFEVVDKQHAYARIFECNIPQVHILAIPMRIKVGFFYLLLVFCNHVAVTNSILFAFIVFGI